MTGSSIFNNNNTYNKKISTFMIYIQLSNLIWFTDEHRHHLISHYPQMNNFHIHFHTFFSALESVVRHPACKNIAPVIFIFQISSKQCKPCQYVQYFIRSAVKLFYAKRKFHH